MVVCHCKAINDAAIRELIDTDRPTTADVAGRSVLEWQLHEIARCNIDEVVVVTGFSAEAVDALRVHWPDGSVQDVSDVPIDTLLIVKQAP